MIAVNNFWRSLILPAVCAALPMGALGCSSAPDEAADVKQIVYVCSETKKLVLAPPQPTPAENPATGRRTLLRALYCPQCKTWQAAPPSDQSATHPLNLRCQKHNVPLTVDGPIENAQTVD